jgi:hypothetical protein
MFVLYGMARYLIEVTPLRYFMNCGRSWQSVQNATDSSVWDNFWCKCEIKLQIGRRGQTTCYQPYVTPVLCCIIIIFLLFYPFLTPHFPVSLSSSFLSFSTSSYYYTVPHPLHHFDCHYCLAYLPHSPNTCVSSSAVSASRIHITCFTPAQPDMCMLPDNRIASLR